MCKCKQLCVILLAMAFAQAGPAESTTGGLQRPDISYTNVIVDEVPWSIQLVTIRQAGRNYSLQSYHAGAGALGMETVSAQVKAAASDTQQPVAAINGGFYLRISPRPKPMFTQAGPGDYRLWRERCWPGLRAIPAFGWISVANHTKRTWPPISKSVGQMVGQLRFN